MKLFKKKAPDSTIMGDTIVRDTFEFLGLAHGPIKGQFSPDGKNYTWSTRADDRVEQELRGGFAVDAPRSMARTITVFAILIDRHPMSEMLIMLIHSVMRYAFPDKHRNHPIEILLRAEIAKAKEAGMPKAKIFDTMIENMNLKQNIEEADFGQRMVRRLRKRAQNKGVSSVQVSEHSVAPSGGDATEGAVVGGGEDLPVGKVDVVPGNAEREGDPAHDDAGQLTGSPGVAVPGD